MFIGQDLGTTRCRSEREVESRIIRPILLEAEWNKEEIHENVPVWFQAGTKRRPVAADLVVADREPCPPIRAWLVAEAKNPTEELQHSKAKEQAWSYSHALRASFYLLCNGRRIQLWCAGIVDECTLIFESTIPELAFTWPNLLRALHRETLITLTQKLVAVQHAAIAHLFARPALHAHHAKAARAIQDQITKGQQHLLVHMAPQTGRASVAVEICTWLINSGKSKSVLLLTPTKLQAEQFIARMKDRNVGLAARAPTFPIRRWTADEDTPGVTTISQIERISACYDAIILDEASPLLTPSYRSAILFKRLLNTKTLLIGFFSAIDPTNHEGLLGQIVYSFSAEQAISEGVLLPTRIIRISIQPSNDVKPEEQTEALHSEQIRMICSDLASRLNPYQGKTIIYCPQIAKAQQISIALQSQLLRIHPDISADLVTSISSANDNCIEQIHDFLHQKKPQIAIGGQTLIKFGATPDITTVVTIGHISSEDVQRKLLTLGALPSPGKSEALVLEYNSMPL